MLIVVAVLAHVVSATSAYPHFLAYTSEYVRDDDGYTVLADSSLDWGQGLVDLREFMEEQEIERVSLAYFVALPLTIRFLLTFGAEWFTPTLTAGYYLSLVLRLLLAFGVVFASGLASALRGLQHGSNLARNKRYDQILHYPTYTKSFTNRGGVLDFYAGGIEKLYPGAGLSKNQFTYQLSDHLPLWAQLDTDTEVEKLDQILQPKIGHNQPNGEENL